MRARNSDAGQVLPLVVIVLVLAVVATLVLARLGGAAAERARARAAADAAALAGATNGRADAESVAHDDGAVVVHYVEVDGEVEVSVVVGSHEASARARRTTVR